eukprot:scaffold388194_cov47-Prasinocladus_malaysianus.AAC.1
MESETIGSDLDEDIAGKAQDVHVALSVIVGVAPVRCHKDMSSLYATLEISLRPVLLWKMTVAQCLQDYKMRVPEDLKQQTRQLQARGGSAGQFWNGKRPAATAGHRHQMTRGPMSLHVVTKSEWAQMTADGKRTAKKLGTAT